MFPLKPIAINFINKPTYSHGPVQNIDESTNVCGAANSVHSPRSTSHAHEPLVPLPGSTNRAVPVPTSPPRSTLHPPAAWNRRVLPAFSRPSLHTGLRHPPFSNRDIWSPWWMKMSAGDRFAPPAYGVSKAQSSGLDDCKINLPPHSPIMRKIFWQFWRSRD